ncbi:MAG: hypothetical protein Q9219_006012 [cf. Caloplaca sp. 3 TL-2023]
MSAPSGPRGFRGSRPPSGARGTFTARGTKGGLAVASARKPRLAPNEGSSASLQQKRPSWRGGPTRGATRRATARGAPSNRATSRQLHNVSRPPISDLKGDTSRDATIQEQPAYRAHMEKTFKTLEEHRRQERKDAIRDGLLADPDKPTTLANAITIVGTCQDMCAEHERLQRITQFMVDDCEKVLHATKEGLKVPLEDRMVKRYRRPAAGYEEQLPSDIRPPIVLQKTLDYLMDDIVGGPEPLSNVHKYVWDRTRAIRNDFSIQQVTKVDELRIAISCFERIARFHILSLHQLSQVSENGVDFDAYQEREQLNNTLLSLMYYYDDSRHKLVSPNEPEFRAYCIIFEIQDQRPDLEDRAQNWPPAILKDRRVQTAMRLYAAAANTSEAQGPLRPLVPTAIAQANPARFFDLMKSPSIPYLMACVAEIYFNKVRWTALDTIWKTYKVKRGGSAKVEDWTLNDFTDALGFDDEGESQTYCEDHGFTVTEKGNGEAYVDLGSFGGRYLSDTNANRKQTFSMNLVEQKRHGRTLPAVVNGMTVTQAQAQGMVVDEDSDNEGSSSSAEETLFLPEGTEPSTKPATEGIKPSDPRPQAIPRESISNTNPLFQAWTTPPTSSDKARTDTPTSTSFFGKPSLSVPLQSNVQPIAPDTNSSHLATASPFSTQRKAEPTGNLLDQPANPNPAPSGSSAGSMLNPKPLSISEPPKFSFGTSPVFHPVGTGDEPKSEKNSTSVNSQFASSPFKAANPISKDQKTSSSPFSFLNPISGGATKPASTMFSQPLNPPPKEGTTSNSTPSSFSSLFPKASHAPVNTSDQQPDKAINLSDPPFTKPNFQSSSIPPLPPNVDSVEPSKPNPPASPDLNHQTQQTPPITAFGSKSVPATTSNPKPAGFEAPDPRPVVLDALAEGLLMEDQGLLQQFIEYTIGPIVREAFQEVEEERSWKRAREVRTVLLRRKYLRSWKDIVWKRKLMRKGKERRAIFAKSMQEMARSSRQRHDQSRTSSQSSLEKENQYDPSDMIGPKTRLPPVSRSQEEDPKRQSRPTDLSSNQLPNTESLQTHKRKRQDPLQESARSLSTPFKHHHKRSRTMGDPRKVVSLYDNLADFSQLDEDASERVIRQARRLVGHAKLDTTRGDYFALKARGIDPDAAFTPQGGTKRSRVDEQMERVRKLLKPPPSDPEKLTSSSINRSDPSNSLSAYATQPTPHPTIPNNQNTPTSPNDLLAQVRQVREALAESTAWFQSEREKSERLSSRRSSEVTHHHHHAAATAQALLPSSKLLQPQEHQQPREWRRPTPTRAQIRLEKTKANGLLPPDWDWNRSVTEWKLRGGVGSPRPGASREHSERVTPAVVGVLPQQQQQEQQQQIKKPVLGFAAAVNGLGPRRREQEREKAEVVYDDDDNDDGEGDVVGEEEEVQEGFEEEEEEEEEEEVEPTKIHDSEEDAEGEEDEGYMNGYGVPYEEYEEGYEEGYEDAYGEEGYGEEEYEEVEVEEEEEEEEDIPAERAVLKSQGNSADTAIDLD